MEVVPIVMTMHWEEKCKSVKRCFFKVKMVGWWWWWYFPRRGFYRLIWHEKAYAFGSEKEVISLSMLSLITFWFANIHELWKLCLSAFDYWEESSSKSPNCSCGCVFYKYSIPHHWLAMSSGMYYIVSYTYLVVVWVSIYLVMLLVDEY